MKNALDEKRISFGEFLEIMRKAYLKTTGAREYLFNQSIAHLEEVYNIRTRVAGGMTIGFANTCADIHTKLDLGL